MYIELDSRLLASESRGLTINEFARHGVPCLAYLTAEQAGQQPFNHSEFALVTRRPYCPGGPKKLCFFTTLSLIPMVSITRLSVVIQSSFGLPGQYGRRVTRVNRPFIRNDHVLCYHLVTARWITNLHTFLFFQTAKLRVWPDAHCVVNSDLFMASLPCHSGMYSA